MSRYFDEEMPSDLKKHFEKMGCTNIRRLRADDNKIILLTVDPTKHGSLWHMSISHPRRYPTWDEIKYARYKFLPRDKDFMMMLPRDGDYVNVHENCFHLCETPVEWGVM